MVQRDERWLRRRTRGGAKVLGLWRWLVLGSLALGGCAFSDGEPWGEASLRLEVRWWVPQDRQMEGGEVRLANDYALRLDDVAAEVVAVTLEIAAPGGEVSSFDPAAPPPGYSLCHGGHCHADDGRLVDYADIEAELSGGASGLEHLRVPVAQAVQFLGEGRDVALGVCPERCWLERGRVVGVQVELRQLRLQGSLRDLRSGAAQRLDGALMALILEVPLTMQVRFSLDEVVGKGEPQRLHLDLSLRWLPQALDGVEWAAWAEPGSTSMQVDPEHLGYETVGEALAEAWELSAEVRR